MRVMTTEIDTEIASKMLSALITADGAPPMQPMCSLEDQKRYLKKYTDTVSVDDRRELARTLARADSRAAMKPCSEGTVINLDALGPTEIGLLYSQLERARASQNNKPSQKYLRH